MKGMEYQDRTGVDEQALEDFFTNPDWVMQQKMDGTRVMIHLETMQVTQRNGSPLKHTAATQWIPEILQELSDLGLSGRANTVLDCELLIHSGLLFVFDVIDTFAPHQVPLYLRIAALESIPESKRVRIVSTAKTEGQKRRLHKICENREGVVVKHLRYGYEPGKRVDHVLKLKNVHTADLVVTKKSEAPLSAGLGIIMGDGQPATLANASLIGKEKDGPIEVGDVVEVSYLYWTGTSLVQPRIMRRRDDKAAVECRMAQFTTYTREAI